MDKWLTQKEAAQILGVSLNQLKYYINTKKVDSGNFYGKILVSIPQRGLKLRKYIKKAEKGV